MAMIIYKKFTFDSAHYLSKVPIAHKCNAVHGHSYTLIVFIEGYVNNVGWIMDYTDLKNAVQPVIDLIDHKLLNDITGLENPTSELLIIWLWDKIKLCLPSLKRLELNETTSSGVIYEG